MTEDTIYGVCSFGQFVLDLKTGKRLWETFAAHSGHEARWGNAFLTHTKGRYYYFVAEKGRPDHGHLARDGLPRPRTHASDRAR